MLNQTIAVYAIADDLLKASYAQPSNSHGRSHESTDAKNLEFDNPQLGLVPDS